MTIQDIPLQGKAVHLIIKLSLVPIISENLVHE